MRKIYFKGYYGFKNLGDDIFTLTSEYLTKTYSKDILSFYVGKKLPFLLGERSRVYESNSSLKLKLMEFIVMLRVDRIIYFGGSLFEDSGSSITNIKYLIRKFNLFKGKLFAFGVSIGPFKNKIDKNNVAELLGKFDRIFVRDNKSMQLTLKMNLGIKSDFVFDPAILIRSIYPDLIRNNIELRDVDTYQRKIIGISLCRYESFKGGDVTNEINREKTLLDTLQLLIANDHVEKLVFFNFNGDEVIGDKMITDDFISKISNEVEVEVINYTSDTRSMLEEFSSCDFILGVRLHSAIIAYTLEIPFMLVEYHTKCTEFLNTINFENRFLIGDANNNYRKIIGNIQQVNMIKPSHFENVILKHVDSLFNFVSVK